MAEKRRYTEEERAIALAGLDAHGGDVSKAAVWAKVPRKTLEYWKNGGGVNEPVANIRQIKKGEIADRLEELVHKLVDAAPNKIEDASLQMIATSIGIAVDKMQLLRSKPTEIFEDASLSDDQRASRIAEILQAARDRRDQPSAESKEPTG